MYLKLIFLLVLAGCGDHVDRPSVTNQDGSLRIGNVTINRISDFSTKPVPTPSTKQHDDHYEGPDLDRNYDDHRDEDEDEDEDWEHKDHDN